MTSNLLVVYGIPLTQKVFKYIDEVMQEDYSDYFNSLYTGCGDYPQGYIGKVITTISRGDEVGKLYSDVNLILCVKPNIEEEKDYPIMILPDDYKAIQDKIKDFPDELKSLLEKPAVYLIWEDV